MIRKSFLKLLPRRFTPDIEIISLGSNQYSTQWVDVEPEKVYQDRGGVDPVELSFSWDDVTKTCTFTTTSVPNENIFIDYPIRFCTETVSYIEDDPSNPAGDKLEWMPRMTDHPDASDSVSNMLNGVLSVSSMNVSLDNSDYQLNRYLTRYDNYKNKKAVVYCQLGDYFKKLAFGYITKTSSGRKVVVSIKSSTKLLEASAILNNRDRYYRYDRSNIPNLPDEALGKPIPVCYGPTSQILGKARIQATYTSGGVAGSTRYYQNPSNVLRKAHRVGTYTYLLGISDNPWSRTSFNTASISYSSSKSEYGRTLYGYNISALYIGYYAEGIDIFCYNAGGTGSIVTIYEIDYTNNRLWVDGSSGYTSIALMPAMFFRREPARVSLSNPDTGIAEALTLRSSRDVNPASIGGSTAGKSYWTFEATDSGQYLLYYTYGTSWRAEYDANWDGVDHYYILCSRPISQTAFIQKYIESTGNQIDSASFAQAQSDVDSNIMITVNGEDSIDNVNKVVENITTSCGGILYMDTETEKFRYRIVNKSMAGTDWVVTSSDILEPDIVPDINYEDTASIIRMQHAYTEGKPFISTTDNQSTSSFSRAFSSEKKSKQINHYLVDTSDAIQFKSEAHNTPIVTYKFSLMADEFIDIDLGDIVEIKNVDGRLLSIDESIRLLVISRTRSVEKVRLVGYDFQKIP